MKTLSQRLVEQADAYVWSELTVKSLLREAAALARRVEEAPSGFVIAQVVLTEPGNAVMVTVDDPSKVKGKRVRIVEE